jgi:glycosyltransferase involved in cell wall biosynthesis
MPTIDVVVPNYQYGRFLRECVESVLTQDHKDLRVLIIDNASTDNSVQIARELAAQDDRVHLAARETNQGHTASCNQGIDWAASDYFMLLYSDNLLAPASLSRAVAMMEKYPDVGFLCGGEIQYWSNRPFPTLPPDNDAREWRILDGSRFIEDRCRTPSRFFTTFLLVRTSVQKQVGHYRAALPYSCDLEILLRLAQLGRVAETDAILGIRREHESNLSMSVWSERWRDLTEREAAFESFFMREGRSMPDADRLLRLARRSLAEWAYWSALSHFFRGQFRTSLNLARFSIRRRPGVAFLPPLGWLFRMDRPIGRTVAVVKEAVGRRLHAS